MQTRMLGRSGLNVAALGLGGNVFGWTIGETTSFEVLDAYVAGGGNFIDTADVFTTWVSGHTGGESESILGKWMRQRGNREQVVIATKVGNQMHHDANAQGLSRRYIFQAIEESLQRLQTDYIDLYQAHSDDEQTPLEETLGAFADLVKQGKVRAIGVSNHTANRVIEALNISEKYEYTRYESLQPHYNLIHRQEYEPELEQLCREQELGVIPYYALASGFLSGKYRRQKSPLNSARVQEIQSRYLNEQGFSLLEHIDRVAAAYNATPAQISLSWLMARPGITAPIASATSVEQMRELLGATKLQLDQESIEALNMASV